MLQYTDVRLGSTQVDKVYAGTDLVFEKKIDTTSPVTTVYPDITKGPYTPTTKVWLEVDEVCTTYYTLDGSTPTTASPIFREAFTFPETTTIKYFSIDLAGNVESVKTSVFPIESVNPIPKFWRYVRFVGHGDQTSATTRLVELQALSGTTNLLLNKLPINAYATPNAGAIGVATDGAIVHSTGYPLWWTGEGVPTLDYDIGDWYDLTSILVVGYSPALDPRQTQFKIFISADNIEWYQVVDYSGNTTAQPEAGFSFPVNIT